jgi:hypothetical protein
MGDTAPVGMTEIGFDVPGIRVGPEAVAVIVGEAVGAIQEGLSDSAGVEEALTVGIVDTGGSVCITAEGPAEGVAEDGMNEMPEEGASKDG